MFESLDYYIGEASLAAAAGIGFYFLNRYSRNKKQKTEEFQKLLQYQQNLSSLVNQINPQSYLKSLIALRKITNKNDPSQILNEVATHLSISSSALYNCLLATASKSDKLFVEEVLTELTDSMSPVEIDNHTVSAFLIFARTALSKEEFTSVYSRLRLYCENIKLEASPALLADLAATYFAFDDWNAVWSTYIEAKAGNKVSTALNDVVLAVFIGHKVEADLWQTQLDEFIADYEKIPSSLAVILIERALTTQNYQEALRITTLAVSLNDVAQANLLIEHFINKLDSEAVSTIGKKAPKSLEIFDKLLKFAVKTNNYNRAIENTDSLLDNTILPTPTYINCFLNLLRRNQQSKEMYRFFKKFKSESCYMDIGVYNIVLEALAKQNQKDSFNAMLVNLTRGDSINPNFVTFNIVVKNFLRWEDQEELEEWLNLFYSVCSEPLDIALYEDLIEYFGRWDMNEQLDKLEVNMRKFNLLRTPTFSENLLKAFEESFAEGIKLFEQALLSEEIDSAVLAVVFESCAEKKKIDKIITYYRNFWARGKIDLSSFELAVALCVEHSHYREASEFLKNGINKGLVVPADLVGYFVDSMLEDENEMYSVKDKRGILGDFVSCFDEAKYEWEKELENKINSILYLRRRQTQQPVRYEQRSQPVVKKQVVKEKPVKQFYEATSIYG